MCVLGLVVMVAVMAFVFAVGLVFGVALVSMIVTVIAVAVIVAMPAGEVLGNELHPALRTAVGLLAPDLRVHRAHVDDVSLGPAEVHLGHERERLVGRRREEGLDPLA